jgi:hypothetical protein
MAVACSLKVALPGALMECDPVTTETSARFLIGNKRGAREISRCEMRLGGEVS